LRKKLKKQGDIVMGKIVNITDIRRPQVKSEHSVCGHMFDDLNRAEAKLETARENLYQAIQKDVKLKKLYQAERAASEEYEELLTILDEPSVEEDDDISEEAANDLAELIFKDLSEKHAENNPSEAPEGVISDKLEETNV